MNEQKWIQILTQFQSQCRGYVMRRGLSLVQAQFEEIVQEIDGGLDHLQWRGNIIPKPHFTDTGNLLLQYKRLTFHCNDSLDQSEMEQKMESNKSEKSLPESDIHLLEKDEAPETVRIESSTPEDDFEEDIKGDTLVIQNLTDNCTTPYSALNSDVRHSSLFPTATSSIKDAPHTLESLKQQRSTLAMELLWIQQAISSRKKYLTLKQKMDVSH